MKGDENSRDYARSRERQVVVCPLRNQECEEFFCMPYIFETGYGVSTPVLAKTCWFRNVVAEWHVSAVS